jgi:hypothetical protein
MTQILTPAPSQIPGSLAESYHQLIVQQRKELERKNAIIARLADDSSRIPLTARNPSADGSESPSDSVGSGQKAQGVKSRGGSIALMTHNSTAAEPRDGLGATGKTESGVAIEGEHGIRPMLET